MDTLEQRSEVRKDRSTQRGLGWMEPCEGMAGARGQVLQGLNAEGRGQGRGGGGLDCLWTVGKAME